MSEDVNEKSSKKAAESSSSSSTSGSGSKTTGTKSAAAKNSSSESKSTSTRSTAASSEGSSSSAATAGATAQKTAGSSNSTGSSASGSGQPQHVASGLAYVLGPITGAIFLFMDRSDSVVRHHSCQALLLSAVIVVAWLAVAILNVNVIGIPLVFWAGLAFLLYMAYLAHKQKSFEIPLLNDYAQRLADKMAPSDSQDK